MPIADISKLSDEEEPPKAPPGAPQAETSAEPAAKKKPKAAPKLKPQTKKPPQPKMPAEPNEPNQPKAKTKTLPMKRPAAAAGADTPNADKASDTVKRRPAAQTDDNKVLKSSKYMYTTGGREGMWGVKINGKEVVRVRGSKKSV